jgi:hypothetical protein
LNDPRGMKREEMIKFFEHIGSRQASHGIKHAFRFKAILSSRKKGSLCKTRYFDDTDSGPAFAQEQEQARNQILPAGTASRPVPRPAPILNPALGPAIQPAYPAPDNASAPIVNPALGPAIQPAYPAPDNASAPLMPTLSYNPEYVFERPNELDPSLDPVFDRFPLPDTSLTLPVPSLH